MEQLTKRLKKRGWTQRDINDAVKAIARAKKSPHPEIRTLNRIIFPLALGLAFFGNVVVGFALIPLLAVLDGPLLWGIVILLGLSFGLLFEIVIRILEHLRVQHHILLSILMPATAIITFIIIGTLANNISIMYEIPLYNDPFSVALTYAIAFMIPYLIYPIYSRMHSLFEHKDL